jgi:hypothetical protein
MTDALVALIVDEGKWLTFSMSVALVGAVALIVRHRRAGVAGQAVVSAAMSLFFALTVGTMAFGHLLAVTTKLLVGTLEGSIAALYAIGIVLAVPSWWLIAHLRRAASPDPRVRQTTLALNGAVVAALLVLGLHNLPLAAPGLVNIAYLLHARRAVGWALVGLALAINLGLFAGSLVFMASGQSFEQFRGIE